MYEGERKGRPSGQACGYAEGAAGWPVHRMAGGGGKDEGRGLVFETKVGGRNDRDGRKLVAAVEINNKSCHVSVTASCSPIWPNCSPKTSPSFLDTPVSANTQLLRPSEAPAMGSL